MGTINDRFVHVDDPRIFAASWNVSMQSVTSPINRYASAIRMCKRTIRSSTSGCEDTFTHSSGGNNQSVRNLTNVADQQNQKQLAYRGVVHYARPHAPQFQSTFQEHPCKVPNFELTGPIHSSAFRQPRLKERPCGSHHKISSDQIRLKA